MKIHILGIAGTFMSGIALIAKELGHTVTGQDINIYPPMSEQLSLENINVTKGYHCKDLPKADVYIIGNALSRGNACVEYILEHNLNYTSAPKWLGENILKNKWVIAVSGTHGKTTTSSLITHILIHAGYNPSYLIGGIANNLTVSAKLTDSNFFVIEADEYDTAFFDKRSKFIHYFPNTLIVNNLEFDHADIFDSTDDIITQFHHLIRTLPSTATIIYPQHHTNIKKVLTKGVYSHEISFTVPAFHYEQSHMVFSIQNTTFTLPLLGEHNVHNATSAILACHNVGITYDNIATAMKQFQGIKRRMEIRYTSEQLTIYDDFAHHPTSIRLTLESLRQIVKNEPITIALELRSNTMKTGLFNKEIAKSVKYADKVLVLEHLIKADNVTTYSTIEQIIDELQHVKGHLIIMSNGIFNNLLPTLLKKI